MAEPSSHMWYVKAAGGVWGPYPEARLHTFVAEGRVTADTPVSPWAEGPFAAASGSAEFAERISAAKRPQARPSEPAPARSLVVQPQPQALRPAPDTGPTQAVLIWARVAEASAPKFLAELAALGHGITLQPGLWLVQARGGASTLRNRLSRSLGPTDTLLVVQAPLERAAWFNLDPTRDRQVRRLWAAGAA